jgi:hypothetical protein
LVSTVPGKRIKGRQEAEEEAKKTKEGEKKGCVHGMIRGHAGCRETNKERDMQKQRRPMRQDTGKWFPLLSKLILEKRPRGPRDPRPVPSKTDAI